MQENVILIDADDNIIGTMEKLEAHVQGKLHRAFSVFIFNTQGQLLLQQRARHKYHSGGKWTNTCCSHPRLGEDTLEAAHRRLNEEMGMQCELKQVFSFTYQAQMEDGITEHELDYVFFGVTNELPTPNPFEVAGYQYMALDKLASEINLNPEQYTQWLKICFGQVTEHYHKLVKPTRPAPFLKVY
jgi:isopentenyl-diphosphate delta-isomerase